MISPTMPIAKLVATRASCLSDFVLTDTSPSANGPSVIFSSVAIDVKEPCVHVRSYPTALWLRAESSFTLKISHQVVEGRIAFGGTAEHNLRHDNSKEMPT